ncbi:L-threonylcarbamoyladenylate synthase [Erythrobacter sp. HKB08]|uniref:L-threonylcarbamoyladenylate synthase n=1 Tax=Erythrobacter sp. HKB08 TaxID=2502843 RepID=UPI00100902C5|nr:L-threonylcarbamoyladenylate synthase [Erythrobacter sp. HKB08]
MTGKNATETLRADAAGIAHAAAILERGGLVAVPTETVYGLAARADSAEAVARIYAAKGRPSFNPLIVHVRDAEQAQAYAQFDEAASLLAENHWPGPLTLVLPRKKDANLAPAVTAGLPTIALRAPAHPVMHELLGAVDFPLAAPSANRSGFISPTSAAHVLASLDGRIDAVIDGGESEAGLESTIVAIREGGKWDELRPGPFDTAAMHRFYYDRPLDPEAHRGGVEAPGQLSSHYAPGKPVRLEASEARNGEFMIGFGDVAGDCTLSSSGDLTEAAASLYRCLHEAAVSQQPEIAVAPIPNEGIGKAINDRLRRAAA